MSMHKNRQFPGRETPDSNEGIWTVSSKLFARSGISEDAQIPSFESGVSRPGNRGFLCIDIPLPATGHARLYRML